MKDPTALLAQAIEAHRAGDRSGAEALYRQVLARDAAQAEALYGLGVLARQAGRMEEAVRLMRAAVESAPANAALHSDLGLVLQSSDRPEEAIAAYRGALALKPDYPPALYNLGNALRSRDRLDEALSCYLALLRNGAETAELHAALGMTYDRLGRLDEARTHFERALTLKPNLASAHCSLGSVLGRQNALAEAIGHFREAVILKPDYVDAWYQLGYSNNLCDDLTEAIACYRKAIELRPDHVEAHNSLGFVLFRQGSVDEAVGEYRKALALRPGYAAAAFNLGVALRDLGCYGEAEHAFHIVIAHEPHDFKAYVELGSVYYQSDKKADALTCFKRAIDIKHDHALAHYYIGTIQLEESRWEEAEETFRYVLTLEPQFSEAQNNLGSALFQQNRIAEAMIYFEKASQNPGYIHIHKAHSNLGIIRLTQDQPDEAAQCFRNAITFQPSYAPAHLGLGTACFQQGDLNAARTSLRTAIELQPDLTEAHETELLILNYELTPPVRIAEAHREYASQFEGPLIAERKTHPNLPDPNRRLKIGYVSPDFHRHSVPLFVESIFAHHDHHELEVYGYYCRNWEDEVTARLRAGMDHWIPCKGMSDEALAERIRSDGIDVLVDLAGHTRDNRLLVFARKPAPVQVTYLGYVATTGLSAMDWRLGHEDVDPPGSEAWNSERIYRLPRSLWCYRPAADLPKVVPDTPARRQGHMTFGSMNHVAKLSDATLDAWAVLLRRLPSARLVIAGVPAGRAQALMRERFAGRDVEPARLELHGKMPQHEFRALYARIDVALDPFPLNGNTTTCESLYLGVPVVTLVGSWFVARFGYHLMKTIGLTELAARDEAEYVAIAEALANDLDRLEALRRGMRSRLESSALRDEVGFTRELEAAYREMWRDWCRDPKGRR